MTIQIKTIEQYFHVELFIILNTVVLIFTWGTTRDMVLQHAVQNCSNFNVARLTLGKKALSRDYVMSNFLFVICSIS